MSRVNSIRTQFAIICIVFITLILGLFGLFQFTTRRTDLINGLKTVLQGSSDRLTLTLPPTVWNFDVTMAKSTLESELGDPAIVGAMVYLGKSQSGELFAGLVKKDGAITDYIPTTMNLQKNEVDQELPLQRDGAIIAVLVIRYTTELIQKKLTSYVISQIAQIIIIDLVLSLLIFFLISGIVITPIRILGRNLEEIAHGEGDLTNDLPVKGNGEIADVSRSFNFFQTKLSSLINKTRSSIVLLQEIGHELNANAAETAASIHEITANIASIRNEIGRQKSASQVTSDTIKNVNDTVLTLCERIEAQFRNIQVSSSAIEEMVANIKSVSNVVGSLDTEHQELVHAAETGRQRLDEVNERVATILANSANLEEANLLIANIASQTNLLAMNAAIEAAHAGEAGKGFSVVADEIRKLAEDSAEQSKTTSDMLKVITESITTADTASKEAEKAFRSIMEHLHRITDLERQIDAAMKEQTTGSTQILENLQAINESSVAVRESAKDITQLNTRITGEIDTLNQITYQIHGSIDEITLGTEEVNQAVTNISDMSIRNKDVSDQANRELSVFKTRQEG